MSTKWAFQDDRNHRNSAGHRLAPATPAAVSGVRRHATPLRTGLLLGLLAVPMLLGWRWLADDALELTFSLPPGTYATVVLAELGAVS